MQSVIYLDNNATTPVNQKVLDAMIPYFNVHYGNPSSSLHSQSWSTAGGVKNARLQVANLVGAENPSEIIFTSGATESINLAIKGLLDLNPDMTLITSNIEHAATRQVADYAERSNINVVYLKAQNNGLVDLEDLEQSLKKSSHPKIVSLILANNEIGSLYDHKAVGALKKSYDFLLHWDATQALLTTQLNAQTDSFDLLSLSAHKIYGPKGVGALYLRKSSIGHQLEPIIYGGGQEFGLRSGTLNVPGIVGLGEACKLVMEKRDLDKSHFNTLYKEFENLLKTKMDSIQMNGDPIQRIYQNISLTLPDQFSNIDLISHLSGFCLSQGSACGAAKSQLNPVLKAIGLTEAEIARTLRIGLGRDTSLKDLEIFVDRLVNRV